MRGPWDWDPSKPWFWLSIPAAALLASAVLVPLVTYLARVILRLGEWAMTWPLPF